MLSQAIKSRLTLLKYQNRAFGVDLTTPCIFKDLKNHGYLPSTKPMLELPSQFAGINQLLDDMTWIQADGSEGLLARNKLRSTVDAELPDYMAEIAKVDKADERLNAALFRDFSMLSAAYLLEPCHINYKATKEYGLGSDFLPETIAVPLNELCKRVRYGQP